MSIFLGITLLESIFRFSSVIRGILLFTFIATFGFILFKYIGNPALVLMGLRNGFHEEEAAKQIGKYFPQVGDRLLNLLQLEKEAAHQGSLVRASIEQRVNSLAPIRFDQAVDYSSNKKNVKYALLPVVAIAAVALISPSLLPSSSERIVNFGEEFAPQAPFSFEITSGDLQAFKNEDFSLQFRLDGSEIPVQSYLIDNQRRIKLFPDANGLYSYTFSKIQRDKNIVIEAAGFTSEIFEIDVVERPDLLGFNVSLVYPEYLGRQKEQRNNSGNLLIPEGTRVTWSFETQAADEMVLQFGDESITPEEMSSTLYSYTRVMDVSSAYEISLSNQYGTNRDPIIFEAEVIPDNPPELSVDVYRDSVMYKFVALRGDLQDDYGITRLALYTRNRTLNASGSFSNQPIEVTRQPNQRFYYQWDLDSLASLPGTELEFYVQVWDNDGFNGRKATKSPTYVWKIPGDEEIQENLDRIAEQTENKINETLQSAQDLEERVKEAEERMRGKREMDFQDEMYLKELLEKREELEKALQELTEQNKESLSQRDRFNKEQNEQLQKKAEQLQELMDQLMDEETRELYEKLQKLLEEDQNLEEYRKNLEKLSRQESNLAKELERTLELFKRLQIEQKMSESLEELNEQVEKQEELLEQTQKSQEEENSSENQENTPSDNEEKSPQTKTEENKDLVEQQQELQEEFKETKEKLEEIQELNQDLKRPESLPDTEYEEEEVERLQEDAKNQMEQQQMEKSSESQQGAVQEMKQMQQKMQQMQASMQMEVMQENMDDLRDIMHNLLTLSFDQESLIDEFREVKQSDPRFVSLGQEQLKIRDDAQIIEDSLMSLAERVFQLQAFVTREVESMNYHLDKSLEGIKERKKPNATAEQQFAMTAMNNLALLLDDVMEQMQNSMMNGQGGQSGQKQPMPSLGQLQQQLNQQIEDLKNSGQNGRQLSEELARLAAEQERIRQAFEEMQKKFGESQGGNLPGDGIPQDMEQTELDLVNKQLTDEMIERQRKILSRMLEAEDALREQDMDEERKGETAKDYEKIKPKEFDDYFKLKKQEIELLRTLPPKLFPYYKKEVNDYFNRIGDTNKTINEGN